MADHCIVDVVTYENDIFKNPLFEVRKSEERRSKLEVCEKNTPMFYIK